MQHWVSICERVRRRGIDVLVYVNNHYAGHAPAIARAFEGSWCRKENSRSRRVRSIRHASIWAHLRIGVRHGGAANSRPAFYIPAVRKRDRRSSLRWPRIAIRTIITSKTKYSDRRMVLVGAAQAPPNYAAPWAETTSTEHAQHKSWDEKRKDGGSNRLVLLRSGRR